MFLNDFKGTILALKISLLFIALVLVPPSHPHQSAEGMCGLDPPEDYSSRSHYSAKVNDPHHQDVGEACNARPAQRTHDRPSSEKVIGGGRNNFNKSGGSGAPQNKKKPSKIIDPNDKSHGRMKRPSEEHADQYVSMGERPETFSQGGRYRVATEEEVRTRSRVHDPDLQRRIEEFNKNKEKILKDMGIQFKYP